MRSTWANHNQCKRFQEVLINLITITSSITNIHTKHILFPCLCGFLIYFPCMYFTLLHYFFALFPFLLLLLLFYCYIWANSRQIESGSCRVLVRNSGIFTEIKHIHTHICMYNCNRLLCVPTCVYYDYYLRQICQNDKIFFAYHRNAFICLKEWVFCFCFSPFPLALFCTHDMPFLVFLWKCIILSIGSRN